MLRVLLWLSIAVCALLGLIHVAATFTAYQRLTPGAVWFAGTGVALILLALLNSAVWHVPHPAPLPRRLAHLANLLMAGLGVLAVRAVPEPQAYIVLASLLGLLIAGIGLERADARPTDPRSGDLASR